MEVKNEGEEGRNETEGKGKERRIWEEEKERVTPTYTTVSQESTVVFCG